MATSKAHPTSDYSEPASEVRAVTPNDSTDLRLTDGSKTYPRGLYIGGAGNVNLVAVDDSSAVLFSAVPAGTILPVRCQIVKSTSTTATLIVALY